MSEDSTDEDRGPVLQQMLAFDCTYCGMTGGAWCVTKSGGRASYLHSDRWWAWKNAQADQHSPSTTRGT